MTDADGLESSLVQNVTAVDGFAYGVIGADLHVFPDRGPVYLLAEHRLAQEPDSEWLVAQPSRMLNARYAVVDFTGRRTEQAGLAAWLDTGSRLAARWLHAPGGQGKTRLAAEFAVESAAAGWKVAVATHGAGTVHAPTGSQDLRTDGAAGLLLVVDYADRWPLTHLTWLFSNALFHRQVPTRLLLLARTVQPWPALRSAMEDHQADVSDQLLSPLPVGDKAGERAEMFAVARKSFAARYGITDPAVVEGIAPPGPLEHGDFGSTLAVHMAALAAVDARARDVRPPVDLAGLTAYLLDRERRGWTRLYENRLEGLDFRTPPSVMARTVFTAALTGPASHQKGREILARLDMEGHPDRLLSDHAACYPPTTADSVLEPLYPDRLAEDFLALSLPGHTLTAHAADSWAAAAAVGLASRDDEGTPPAYIARTLTFLAAAAAPGRWTHVSTYLNAFLSTDPSLAIAAGGAALTAVAEAVSIDVLGGIEAHLPSDRNVDLDPAAAVIATRLHAHLIASATDDDERARLHAGLGLRLGNAGRAEEALAATTEAADIYRRLATARPDAFESGLGSNLALGRSFLYVLAAFVYWRLAAGHPGVFKPDIALALIALGAVVALRGRKKAPAVSAEAAEMRRRLAAAGPNAFEPDLAGSLNNLGLVLAGLERGEEALAITAEAAEIGRRLAAGRPDAFEPDLAASLWAYAVVRVAGKADLIQALTAAEEAVTRYEALAARRPLAFADRLAGALTTMADVLDGLDRAEEAAAVRRRAGELDPA